MNDHRLGALFLLMVEKLKEFYRKQVLPHYFIQHWNLLRGFSKEEAQQVVDLLEDVSQNPGDYITYIHDTKKYVAPQAVQNGGTYKDCLQYLMSDVQNIFLLRFLSSQVQYL